MKETAPQSSASRSSTSSTLKKHTIELNLKGQTIVLKTEADPVLAEQVTKLVKERLAQAEARVQSSAPHLSAILALFDLAEEYVQAKARAGQHQETFERKTKDLLHFIDSEIG